MDLAEQLSAAQAEVKFLREKLAECNAERIAIDNMYMEKLKQDLLARKNAILQAGQYPSVDATLNEPCAELQKDGEVVPLHVEAVEQPVAESA